MVHDTKYVDYRGHVGTAMVASFAAAVAWYRQSNTSSICCMIQRLSLLMKQKSVVTFQNRKKAPKEMPFPCVCLWHFGAICIVYMSRRHQDKQKQKKCVLKCTRAVLAEAKYMLRRKYVCVCVCVYIYIYIYIYISQIRRMERACMGLS
jgi:hypothetical protein